MIKYSDVKKRAKKDYERVIDKFIEFSTELNPENLELFMELTFKITNENSDFKLPYSGSQIKYANTIKRFLQNIYSLNSMKLNLKYYERKRKNMEGISKKKLTKMLLEHTKN